MGWISNGGKEPYLNAARKAVADDKVFSIFKRFAPWQRIVGYPCLDHASKCYRNFMGTPEIMDNLETFLKNDTLGKPMLVGHKYGVDTLRFVESVWHLFKRFKDLNGKTVVELGSNYGGLMYCILTQWEGITKYHCLDLPEVQDLSKHYLNRLGFSHSAISYDQPTEQPFLFISEYCLTEFTDEELYNYYNTYVKNSQAILIRANLHEEVREKAFFRELQKDFTLEVIKEPPTRGINKVILGWK